MDHQFSRATNKTTIAKLLKELDKEGGPGEYFFVHPDDLDKILLDNVSDSLWAFKPEFLADCTDLPADVFQAIADNDKCEGNNGTIAKLLAATCGLEWFAKEAVLSDGAGHFLAGYDGDEVELSIKVGRRYVMWTAYRTN